MREFFAPKGNHGYGFAVAAGEGYVTMGLRQKEGQGEVLGFNSVEDFAAFMVTMSKAGRRAFGTPDIEGNDHE